MELDNKLQAQLIKSAREARENAYAPYSKFKVGAAVLVELGKEEKIFPGTNVENISFGLTNCAERTAIFTAISNGAKEIKALAIVTNSKDFISPCGACRQVLDEFADKNCPVILSNMDGLVQIYSLGELLPYSFNGF